MNTTGSSTKKGSNEFTGQYVSGMSLNTNKDSLLVPKMFAEKSSSKYLYDPKKDNMNNISCRWRGNTTMDIPDAIKKVPIICIGDGIDVVSMGRKKELENQVYCKRVNIRIAAFENEQDKKDAAVWLKLIRDQYGVSEVSPLKFCTYKDLDSVSAGHGVWPCNSIRINIGDLWDRLEEIG